jgi:deoxyribonuclease-4
MYLGAHMPVSGGLHLSIERIRSVRGTAMQIFTRNQRQWRTPPLRREDIRRFLEALEEWGPYPVAAHGSYLINLASPDGALRRRSINAFATELRRAERLSIPYLVTHPGSHMDAGVEKGIERCTRSLDAAIRRSGTSRVVVLIENTAGQGTGLGSRFEEIASILKRSAHRPRLGVCLDTCHAFAAGYDFRTRKTYQRTFSRLDRLIGVRRVRFFHVNDSMHELGSRKDRHQHIGKGEIGLPGFRLLMNDPRFQGVGMVLETPKDESLKEDRRNLKVLRSLVKG